VPTNDRAPKHPYTQALIRCCVTETADGQLFVIRGSVPTLTDKVTSCTFADRCHVKAELDDPRCDSREPELMPVGPGHRIRCWTAEES
jgi:peptide/nickel transport system ATP-binding protein